MSEENESPGECITYLESVTRLLDKPCCAECVATAARKMVAMLTAADVMAEAAEVALDYGELLGDEYSALWNAVGDYQIAKAGTR